MKKKLFQDYFFVLNKLINCIIYHILLNVLRDFSVVSTAEGKSIIWGENQDGHTKQSTFWIDKIKWLSPNHVFVQKSKWPYSMQSKFWMDKIRGSYKVEVVICFIPYQNIFLHYLKR